MPRISVIVPVYNVEKYLSRCIDSVLNQTFTDFELILVDDGSPDQSSRICDEYAGKDSRIKVIHKENGGLSSARNAGIDASTGEYLFFCDSDDFIHARSLDILYEAMLADETDVAIGKVLKVLEFNVNLCYQQLPENRKVVLSGGDIQFKYFEDRNNVYHYVSSCGKLYKKILFEGIRFPEGKLFEDEFTIYKILYSANKIVIIDDLLYFYFLNDKGITHTLSPQKKMDEFDAQYERIQFYCKMHENELYRLAILEYLRSGQWLIAECVNSNENEVLKRFRKKYRTVCKRAKDNHFINFPEHFDYYIIDKPRYTFVYRVLRKMMTK